MITAAVHVAGAIAAVTVAASMPDVVPEPIPEVWRHVAECESGNDWDIDTGNGFYGGLQFTRSSWEWVGGLEYASRPDLATPHQQVEMAERLLERQGWSAWPVCSRKLGLR